MGADRGSQLSHGSGEADDGCVGLESPTGVGLFAVCRPLQSKLEFVGALENLFRRSREAGVVLARARQRSSPSGATDQGSVDVAKQPMGDPIENDRVLQWPKHHLGPWIGISTVRGVRRER